MIGIGKGGVWKPVPETGRRPLVGRSDLGAATSLRASRPHIQILRQARYPNSCNRTVCTFVLTRCIRAYGPSPDPFRHRGHLRDESMPDTSD